MPDPSIDKTVPSANMPKASGTNQIWYWYNHVQKFLELLLKRRVRLGIRPGTRFRKFSQASPPMRIPVIF